MTYKFLLFDLDHTLLDFDAAEDVALSQLLNEEGVEDIKAYKNYYVPMNKALWKDLEQKKITKQELVNTRFAKLFAHFGIEKDGAYLAERYQFFLSKQGQIFPGVEDLLKKLIHQGYELYAATNGITYIQTGRLEQSGIAPYFKEIFISEQLHTQKPDAAFYEKIGARIPNFDKDHALMIGDSLSADIQGGIMLASILSGTILIIWKIRPKLSQLMKLTLIRLCLIAWRYFKNCKKIEES